MNYYTNASLFQKILEAPLEKKAGEDCDPPLPPPPAGRKIRAASYVVDPHPKLPQNARVPRQQPPHDPSDTPETPPDNTA